MASVATPLKRSFLRNLYWSSEDTKNSLANVLKAAAQAQFKEVSNGRQIYQASANGHYYAWEIPSAGGPIDVAELIEELLTRYDEAVAALDEGAIDSAIFAEMMRCLSPVKSFANDFTYGRIERCDDDE